jgi:hypothetical protein
MFNEIDIWLVGIVFVVAIAIAAYEAGRASPRD